MPVVQNKGLIFTKIPTTFPIPGEHLTVASKDRTFDTDQEPPAGGVTVQNHYLSFDPYQRGRMRDASIASYTPAFTLGQPITNFAVCRVLRSNSEKLKPGTVIVTDTSTPTEEYSVLGAESVAGARPLENPHGLDPATFLGPLGMPGLTAFSSFYEILGDTSTLKKGNVILISAASGAVGQIVGQIAKKEGLVVIGSVGDDKKLDYIIKELGFDAGFNYKKEKPADGLKRCAPNGIDIYYENVGGEHLEAALDAMNNHGKIIACGMISQYNLSPDDRYPIRNLMQVVAKRITMRGFIVLDPDFGAKHMAEHQEKVQQWITEGSMKTAIDITKGIDNAAEAFVGMLQGKNFGKAVLQIAKL